MTNDIYPDGLFIFRLLNTVIYPLLSYGRQVLTTSLIILSRYDIHEIPIQSKS